LLKKAQSGLFQQPASGKALGVVVDAGGEWAPLATALAREGLPVFGRMEDAILGLGVVAGAEHHRLSGLWLTPRA